MTQSCIPHYHLDAVATDGGKAGVETITPPSSIPAFLRDALPDPDFLCAGCGAERRGAPAHVCADCLERACNCTTLMDEALGAQVDTAHLNALDGAMRHAIALKLMSSPTTPVRHIIEEITNGL